MRMLNFQMLPQRYKASPSPRPGHCPALQSCLLALPMHPAFQFLSALPGPMGFVTLHMLLFLPEILFPPSVTWKILFIFQASTEISLQWSLLLSTPVPKIWWHPSVFHPYAHPGFYCKLDHTELQGFRFTSIPWPIFTSLLAPVTDYRGQWL